MRITSFVVIDFLFMIFLQTDLLVLYQFIQKMGYGAIRADADQQNLMWLIARLILRFGSNRSGKMAQKPPNHLSEKLLYD